MISTRQNSTSSSKQGQCTTPRFPDSAFLAKAIRGISNQQHAPISLRRIIAIWPELSVRIEHLDDSGILLDIGSDGGRILIRAQDSSNRRNFTLAHELGHWLLGSRTVAVDSRRHRDIDQQRLEEEWCDRFAYDLLMPREWIDREQYGADWAHTPERLAREHLRYGVSREAFTKRVVDTSQLTVMFIAKNQRSRFSIHAYNSNLSPSDIVELRKSESLLLGSDGGHRYFTSTKRLVVAVARSSHVLTMVAAPKEQVAEFA